MPLSLANWKSAWELSSEQLRCHLCSTDFTCDSQKCLRLEVALLQYCLHSRFAKVVRDGVLSDSHVTCAVLSSLAHHKSVWELCFEHLIVQGKMGTFEVWKFGTLSHWNLEFHLLGKFGSLELETFGTLEVWIFGSLEVWMFVFLEVWKFGSLDAWKFETLKVWSYLAYVSERRGGMCYILSELKNLSQGRCCLWAGVPAWGGVPT